MAVTLFVVFLGSMALSTPPNAAELRVATQDVKTRVVATVEEHAEKTPTPLPKEWLDNANQTNGLLHLNFLDGIPILWIVVIFIALIGAVYYLVVGRTKAFAPVVSPAEDDAPLAGSGAAPPA
jgi:hypothetical protein